MKYTVIETPHLPSDLHPVQIDEGEFTGCQVIFGQLSFDESPIGIPVLKFDYDIVNGYTVKKDRMESFVAVVGQLIEQILVESLEKEDVIYKGGA